MPGMLSDIFDGPEEGDGVAAGLSVEQGLALEIELSNEMGGSYRTLDGSETTWSREDSLGLDVDTGVLLSGDGVAGG